MRRLLGQGAAQQLQQVRLVLWSDYTETEVRAVAMQLRLLEQTLATLAELVQGPCAQNQLVLARACVCENAMPLLDFLLALQLSGGQGAAHEQGAARRVVPLGRGRAASQPQPWAGHEPLRMAQLLEGAMRRAEDAAGRDAVAKFARKLEASEEARQLWQRRGDERLEPAPHLP